MPRLFRYVYCTSKQFQIIDHDIHVHVKFSMIGNGDQRYAIRLSLCIDGCQNS